MKEKKPTYKKRKMENIDLIHLYQKCKNKCKNTFRFTD